MLIELHIIQNFAPSCLNRDDTNSPKDCTFGGHRRARISSQCFKRAIRHSPTFREQMSSGLGERTKLLSKRIVSRLIERGRDEQRAELVARTALEAAGYGIDKDGARTSVLLFLSPGEIEHYASVVDRYWDELDAAAGEAEPEGDGASKKAKGKKDKPKVSKECVKDLTSLGSETDAADIALFGRMIAELPNMNIEGACQVAHAISTHAADIEMDFYTAVDDLQPKEDTGAGMMGVVEFNSACFYRYAVVDLAQLQKNLHGDARSARDASVAFCRAAVDAIPSGKQNSMAAHNPPSYVQVKVRSGGLPRSLANAFAAPVRVTRQNDDLTRASVDKLRAYDGSLSAMYGDDGLLMDGAAGLYPELSSGSLADLWRELGEALA